MTKSEASSEAELTSHEANYNLVAAALATAAATMLTLLTTLGTTSLVLQSVWLKTLLELELLTLEFALIVSVIALIKRGEGGKKRLTLIAAFLVILGTLLLWTSATTLIVSS
ncbi:MAG: hypothetical protein HY247_07760 [archaeon]|nr:MAG: hypothetical protein HY247_07760 [archaeon]